MPRAAAPRTIASYGAPPLSGYAAGSVALKLGLVRLSPDGATPRQLTRTFTMSTPRVFSSSRRWSRCAWLPETSTLSSCSMVGCAGLAIAVPATDIDAVSASTNRRFLMCEPPSSTVGSLAGVKRATGAQSEKRPRRLRNITTRGAGELRWVEPPGGRVRFPRDDDRHLPIADRGWRDPQVRRHGGCLRHRHPDRRRDPDADRDPRPDPVAALHVRLVGHGTAPPRRRSLRRPHAEPAAARPLLAASSIHLVRELGKTGLRARLVA